MICECQVKEDPDKKEDQTCSAGNLLIFYSKIKRSIFLMQSYSLNLAVIL